MHIHSTLYYYFFINSFKWKSDLLRLHIFLGINIVNKIFRIAFLDVTSY